MKTSETTLVSPETSSAIVPPEAGLLITNGIDETRSTVQANLRTMISHVRTSVAVELAETEAVVQEAVLADIEGRLALLNRELGQHRDNPVRLPSLRRRAMFLQGQLAVIFRSMQPSPDSSKATAEGEKLAAAAMSHFLPNLTA